MYLFDGRIDGLVLATLLREGPLSTHRLIERIDDVRHGATKQGVYRVLRMLVKQEKIVIYKSVVSINALWRDRLQRALAGGQTIVLFSGLDRLDEGNRFEFRSNSLVHADQIWSQLFLSIEPIIATKHPLYVYNPHDWFIILRPENERLHAERLIARRPIFLTVGGTTALDRETAVLAQADGYECALNPHIKRDVYIAIIGPYVTETRVHRLGADAIEGIFKTCDSLETAGEHLMALAERRVPVRISIEKNARKAQKWKRRLARDFFVPKRNRDF